MGKIIFITGGARSGKSTLACSLAKRYKGKIGFIATCEPRDSEMKKRIVIHKASRPVNWVTFEEALHIENIFKKNPHKFKAIIIDCVTLWVTNLIMSGLEQAAIEEKTEKLLKSIKKNRADCLIVTNEVGLGIVPENKLARDFRDIAGRVNQILAQQSKTAYFMVAGLPLKLK